MARRPGPGGGRGNEGGGEGGGEEGEEAAVVHQTLTEIAPCTKTLLQCSWYIYIGSRLGITNPLFVMILCESSPLNIHCVHVCSLQACLGQRYDVSTKSLDLSNMYHDPSKPYSQTNVCVGLLLLCVCVCVCVCVCRLEGERSARDHV